MYKLYTLSDYTYLQFGLINCGCIPKLNVFFFLGRDRIHQGGKWKLDNAILVTRFQWMLYWWVGHRTHMGHLEKRNFNFSVVIHLCNSVVFEQIWHVCWIINILILSFGIGFLNLQKFQNKQNYETSNCNNYIAVLVCLDCVCLSACPHIW